MNQHALQALLATAILTASQFAAATPYTLTNSAGSFNNFSGFDWTSNGVLAAPGFNPYAPVSAFTATYFSKAYAITDTSGVAIVGALNNTFAYTIVANLFETSSCIGAVCSFTLTGGSFDIWYDTSPDALQTNGTGFTDGSLLATGSVLAGVGGGYTQLGNSGFGSLLFNAIMTYTNPAYISPPLEYSNSFGTIQVGAFQTNEVSASNFPDGTPILPGTPIAQADGNTSFVPEPASLLLLSAALFGALGLRRQSH